MTNYEIDILKKTLLKVEQKELKRFKNLPDKKIELSEKFENGIQKLAKKRKTLIWQATKTVPRRIAVVFVAAIITFCMMMSISAIRIPVINFFVNIYEEFIGIFVNEEEGAYVPDKIETVALPTYMIDDYILDDSQNYGRDAETYWVNSYGDVIILYQEILEDEMQATIDNENIDYQEETLNNITIYYTINNGEYQLIWSNGGYLFTLMCMEDISFNEIKMIIFSIK